MGTLENNMMNNQHNNESGIIKGTMNMNNFVVYSLDFDFFSAMRYEGYFNCKL